MHEPMAAPSDALLAVKQGASVWFELFHELDP